MATEKELSSVIQIDGNNYSIVAKRVLNSLTIKVGDSQPVTFDGSADTEIDIKLENLAPIVDKANKVQVTLDEDRQSYASITISKNEPTNGEIGDIWFKY